MVKLSEAVMSDARLLETKFQAADQLIMVGDLDYRDFKSPIVRKAVQMQHEYSTKAAKDTYDRDSLAATMSLIKQFLTELKNGGLTEASRHAYAVQLRAATPKERTMWHGKKR